MNHADLENTHTPHIDVTEANLAYISVRRRHFEYKDIMEQFSCYNRGRLIVKKLCTKYYGEFKTPLLQIE